MSEEQTARRVRVIAGVHRYAHGATGILIDAASRARFPGQRWIDGLDGPATHAFIVFGAPYRRLDALPKGAIITPWPGFVDCPTAMWDCGEADESQIVALRGRPYDFDEMFNQGMGVLNNFLSLIRLPEIPTNYDSLKEGCICTALTCQVMTQVGAQAAEVARATMEKCYFPDELGQRLAASGLPRIRSMATLENA